MLLPFTIILILWKWPLPQYRWQQPFLFHHPYFLIGDKTGNRRVPGIDKQGWCGQPGDNISPGWSQSISTYIRTSEGTQPGSWDRTQDHTMYSWATLFISLLKCLTEGEYGILEPKFPDGGHCQSVLRRQCVLFTFHPQCQGRRHLRFYMICEPRGAHLLMLQAEKLISCFYRQHRGSNPGPLACGSNALHTGHAAHSTSTPGSNIDS